MSRGHKEGHGHLRTPTGSRTMSRHTQASSVSTIMTSKYSLASASASNSGSKSQETALSVMTAKYPIESWTFEAGNLLSWPANANVKRTLCTPTPMPTARPHSSATTFMTSPKKTASPTLSVSRSSLKPSTITPSSTPSSGSSTSSATPITSVACYIQYVLSPLFYMAIY